MLKIAIVTFLYTVISIAAFGLGFVLGYRREDKKLKKSLKERERK